MYWNGASLVCVHARDEVA